jgi:hypothetical protein
MINILLPKLLFFLETTKKIERNLQLISKLLQKTVNYKLLFPGGPIPHKMARALMPRQPYSVAVLSTGGRLHP